MCRVMQYGVNKGGGGVSDGASKKVASDCESFRDTHGSSGKHLAQKTGEPFLGVKVVHGRAEHALDVDDFHPSQGLGVIRGRALDEKRKYRAQAVVRKPKHIAWNHSALQQNSPSGSPYIRTCTPNHTRRVASASMSGMTAADGERGALAAVAPSSSAKTLAGDPGVRGVPAGVRGVPAAEALGLRDFAPVGGALRASS